MRVLPAACAGLLLIAGFADFAGADPLQDCLDAAEAPGDVQGCLARRQLEAERRLDKGRERLQELARQRDALNDTGETLAAVIAAEEAFDAYVDASCLAVARLGIGERQAEGADLERACRARLLAGRADDLESLVGGLP